MIPRIIMFGIYFRIFTRIDSLFRAGACTLCFLTFWLIYTDGCRADAMFGHFVEYDALLRAVVRQGN